MIKETKEAFETIALLQKNWDSPLALVILSLIALCGGLTLAYHIDLFGLPGEISLEEWLAVAILTILLVAVWYVTSRPRRTLHGKIGIVVAIGCETHKERLRLKADFVRALNDEISRTSWRHFDVFELSEYHAQRAQSLEGAVRYLRATQAHLIIFGQCRVRLHRGQTTYVLDLQEAVRHAPIPAEVSTQLSQDMRLALPNKMLIPEVNEVEGFEITKDMVGIAAQFTLGIASLLSGDPITAFDLHHGAWRDATQKVQVDENTPAVYKTLRFRMANFLVLSGLQAARLYYKDKPQGYLDRVTQYLDIVQEIDPNNYDAHLARAACCFLRDHDIEGAKTEIKKARNERNAAWQYSEAFLAAYEGKLEDAHKIYRRAFRGSVLEETPLDVEIFISDVLESEPDKIQLWYCIGMINYFYKKDLGAARRDFTKFIQKATQQGKFSTSLEYARKYLQEIDEKLRESRI